ncbi:hypothetical protein B0H14DRAFT_3425593 [Mycena olivaceomarginata]|nr:hypothetical protein B0H14DRAFT_3425593 [Mycena olivaceomarginata]
MAERPSLFLFDTQAPRFFSPHSLPYLPRLLPGPHPPRTPAQLSHLLAATFLLLPLAGCPSLAAHRCCAARNRGRLPASAPFASWPVLHLQRTFPPSTSLLPPLVGRPPPASAPRLPAPAPPASRSALAYRAAPPSIPALHLPAATTRWLPATRICDPHPCPGFPLLPHLLPGLHRVAPTVHIPALHLLAAAARWPSSARVCDPASRTYSTALPSTPILLAGYTPLMRWRSPSTGLFLPYPQLVIACHLLDQTHLSKVPPNACFLSVSYSPSCWGSPLGQISTYSEVSVRPLGEMSESFWFWPNELQYLKFLASCTESSDIVYADLADGDDDDEMPPLILEDEEMPPVARGFCCGRGTHKLKSKL